MIFTTQAMAQTANYRKDLDMFPKPDAGYKQVVIEVSHSDKDKFKKIEFEVGKYLKVDKCNQHTLGGEVTKKDLSGWGYSYYVFKTKGAGTSTLIGCPDNTKVRKFVTASPKLINYNGKLPIVIYVPNDTEVQYKIYETNGGVFKAKEIRKNK